MAAARTMKPVRFSAAEHVRIVELVRAELKCWDVGEPEHALMLSVLKKLWAADGCRTRNEPPGLVESGQPAA